MKVGLVSGSPKHFTQKHGQCQEVALHTFLEPIANFNGDFYLNAAIWVTLILWGGTWSLVTSPSWIFTRIETNRQKVESSDKDEEFGAAKSSPLKAWPDINFGQAFNSLGFEIKCGDPTSLQLQWF